LRLAKRLAIAGVLVLGMSGPVVAGFEEGAAAYKRGDYKTAYEELLPLAQAGDADAQEMLGFLYRKGLGVPKDDAEAVKWYRRAAEQGNVHAQLSLGVAYAEGDGLPQDYAEAAKWFRKAAAQGLARAQFNLGLMYAKNQGVPEDYILAHMWLNIAAVQGYREAAKFRNLVAKILTPANVAKAQKMAREWKPKK
jgi:TPR repeat protein